MVGSAQRRPFAQCPLAKLRTAAGGGDVGIGSDDDASPDDLYIFCLLVGALLQTAPDVDIVLMDIMRPEMDGIDTMKAIRQISHFKDLPIIAVTAKAMQGDREMCIEAGVWDYLSKPVDPERLLTVLRAWLTV